MIESISMLERLANPNKPPLSIADLEDLRLSFMDPSSNKEELGQKLEGMAVAFQGQGDLSEWHFETLDAIDECFVKHYMPNGEISTSLFVPDSAENLNMFSAYCDAVDQVLRSKMSQRPQYAREYFAYFSIWKIQGYSFPVPLGTKSAILALNILAGKFNNGLVEVSSNNPFIWLEPRIGTHPIRGWKKIFSICNAFSTADRMCSYPRFIIELHMRSVNIIWCNAHAGLNRG